MANRDAAKVRIPPPFLYLIPVALGVLLHRYALPWPVPGPDGPVRAAIAVAVVAVGVGVALAALGLFWRTGQNPEPWKPTPSIVSDGIYRFTRNPMYVGLAIIQIGAGIGAGTLWITALTPLSLIAVYWLAVRPEEAYLEAKFGDEYLRYKTSVRRWI